MTGAPEAAALPAEFRVPRTGERSLAEVLPSVAASFGLAGYRNALELPTAEGYVVVLVDGLGWRSLVANADIAPFLGGLARGAGEAGCIDAAFPSTTSVGLTSLGTGSPPGQHGIVGAGFRIGETGHILWPLAWPGAITAEAVQPHPTMLQILQQWHIDVTVVSDPDYRYSGLTQAALRGGRYAGARTAGERIAAAQEAMRSQPAVAYVYHSELDRTGHEFGVDSPQWRDGLRDVDRFCARLADQLPAGVAMLVTADHGMVDCPAAQSVALDDEPALRTDVAAIAGEPRMRHIYAREGAAAAVLTRWRRILGDRAVVLAREEAVSAGLFGPVAAGHDVRIGDVIAIARGRAKLASQRIDSIVSGLRGQHGGLSAEEIAIPLLLMRS